MGLYQPNQPNFWGGFGQGLSQGFQNNIQQRKEQDAINNILQRMSEGGDPLNAILSSNLPMEQKQGLLNTMGQFQERTGKAELAQAEAMRRSQQERNDIQAINQELESRGMKPLPEGTSLPVAKEFLKIDSPKDKQKAEEKIRGLDTAKNTIGEMRKIRSKGNLGIWAKGGLQVFGGETAKDKGKYEQLGKSLISYASNIPIRNRQEFETLAERLYSASISDAEAEGVLDAMEEIIEGAQYEVSGGIPKEVEMKESVVEENGKVLTQDVMKVIIQRSGGDKEKAKKIAKEMGYRLNG